MAMDSSNSSVLGADELREQYVGIDIRHVPTPAAVVDRAIVKRNCSQMLEACQTLHCSFRPHVKTHKAVEVTQLQIGESSEHVQIVVSTLAEFHHLLDYLVESQARKRRVNVLYGVPAPPSTIRRLAQLGKKLGPGSVSILVDHPDQLQHLNVFEDITGYPLLLFIKIDTGYHRAGIVHGSSQFSQLVSLLFSDGGHRFGADFYGLYSHAGHSYNGSSAEKAMDLLIEEVRVLQSTAAQIRGQYPARAHIPMVLSVGATPTASSIQNLFNDNQGRLRPGQAETLEKCLSDIRSNGNYLELHAGVYPFLDLQQLETEASPSASMSSGVNLAYDMALTILAEVASIYDSREEREALIAAGSLALGREPCRSYQGWGYVSNWNVNPGFKSLVSDWYVSRISQEHGILRTESKSDERSSLAVGQKVRVFPNHACIAGAGFSWYFVVDSDLPGEKQDEVVDIWVRCRGW
ncbi:MAG: hypothetical protein Q9219_000333 [cf. Caloplaca sp. 3 TL-2023]